MGFAGQNKGGVLPQSKRGLSPCLTLSALLLCLFAAALMSLAAVSRAQAAAQDAPPKVAVSIKPLHSLVSAVMAGAAAPALIVQGEGSEHGYQLRPQDAENLSKADIVFWAGPQMEVFLRKPLQVLCPQADKIALAQTPGIRLLPMRTGGSFEADDDVPQAADSADNADLHFWLDPQNAKAAVAFAAAVLSAKDPARASLYQQNAKQYQQRLDSLTAHINAELLGVRGRPYIVFHDAYQYFERRFAVPAAGSITVNPERAPGAKRLAEIHAKIQNLAAADAQAGEGRAQMNDGARVGGRRAQINICVFAEPQFEPRLVQAVTDGTQAKIGVLDPLGSDLPSGADQYPRLMQNLADSLRRCLAAP